MADPSLLDTVDGLSPNAEEHQTAVDVEPVSLGKSHTELESLD